MNRAEDSTRKKSINQKTKTQMKLERMSLGMCVRVYVCVHLKAKDELTKTITKIHETKHTLIHKHKPQAHDVEIFLSPVAST